MRLETILTVERNARRVGEITGVLARHGLADWLGGLNYEWIQERLRSPQGEPLKGLPLPVRIRLALTELGTTFIKLGQMLSTRADLIGPDLARELSHLQVATSADEPAVVHETIRRELGQPPEFLFATFDSAPLASASIAQVHPAQLHSGEDVVVKVMRSGIEEKVARDLDILAALAELAERTVAALRPIQPVALARHFRMTLNRELDFLHEKRNLEQFAHSFEDDPTVHFPSVAPFYCTRRVLTMERLVGVPGTDEEGLRRQGVDLNAFAHRGAQMYLNMIFRDGFYHADPHPGNLMLLRDGVVGVLDCGMIGRLDETLREEVENLLIGAVALDAEQLTDAVLRLGAVPAECRREELRAEVADFIAEHTGRSLSEFDLSGALSGLTDIIRRYQIVLPPSLSMLLKVLMMLEGTSRRLDPQFSLAEIMRPFYQQTVRRRFAPRRVAQRLGRAFQQWERLLDTLPRDLSDILARARAGTLSVRLEHHRVESTVNRLVCGVLAASLFIGSSLLWSTKAPPVVYGVSVVGALGYLGAIYLTWRTLRAVRKSGDLRDKD